jgi:hypothetical protein
MPDTTPSDDAAHLTALLCDYGGLWDITRTPQGYTATRRPPPAPPLTLTAGTVTALRELLEHGYDTGTLAALLRDFGSQWQIEHLDPGSTWAAVSHHEGHTQVLTAADLDALRGKLGRAPQ